MTTVLGTRAMDGVDRGVGENLVAMDDMAFAEPQADDLFGNGFE